MQTLAALLRNRDFLRRLGVTLAVLVVYRVGCWIPLPGLELSALMPTFGVGSLSSVIERISVFALGINPMLSALIVIELVMMLWPPFRRWAQSQSNAANFDGWIVVGTLAFAAFQANGIAVALEQIGALVPSTGLAFRAGVIVSLVAGTAFLVWMAALVTRRGLGSGFLLLLAAPILMVLPAMFTAQAAAWGPASELGIPLTATFLAVAIAGLVAAAVKTPSLVGNGQLFWPPMLAYAAPALLLLIPLLLGSLEGFEAILEAFKLGQPSRVVILPALTLAFYLWRARSLAAAGPDEHSGTWVAPLLLVAVVAATEFVIMSLPAPFVLDGRSVAILVAFALSMLAAVRTSQSPSTERTS